jgi:2-keto-3-deoxy-L-rhamnonate aldolase RhmA
MIEKKSAMQNLDEILSVEGVDMVQFGPSDYSISIGKPGQARHPDVQNAEIEMVKRALKKGIQPRVEANDLEEAKKFMDLGVRHMCIGTDLGTIGDWCKQQTKGGIASLLKSV